MRESRVDRLMAKAEQAADRGDLERSEQFANLAGFAFYVARVEAKAIERMTRNVTPEPVYGKHRAEVG